MQVVSLLILLPMLTQDWRDFAKNRSRKLCSRSRNPNKSWWCCRMVVLGACRLASV